MVWCRIEQHLAALGSIVMERFHLTLKYPHSDNNQRQIYQVLLS